MAMKQVFFLVVVMLLFVSNQSFAQSAGEKSTTIFYYDLMIDDNFRSAVIGADEKVQNFKEVIKGKDPLKEGIIDNVFGVVTNSLESETEYRFLPINTLQETKGKNVFYTARDYPLSSQKRAITHNTSDYYVSMNVQIYSRFTTGSKTAVRTPLGNYDKDKKKLRPTVVIRYKVYDKNGKKVASYKGKAKTKEIIEVKGQTIMNWFSVGEQKRLDDEANQNVLNNVIDEAVKDLLNKMNGIE